MNPMAIVTLVLVGVGVLLIFLGTWLSLADWKKSDRFAHAPKEEGFEGVGDTLTGLARLVEALKGYPVGRQLIVLGIVVLIIAGLFGGISSLR